MVDGASVGITRQERNGSNKNGGDTIRRKSIAFIMINMCYNRPVCRFRFELDDTTFIQIKAYELDFFKTLGLEKEINIHSVVFNNDTRGYEASKPHEKSISQLRAIIDKNSRNTPSMQSKRGIISSSSIEKILLKPLEYIEAVVPGHIIETILTNTYIVNSQQQGIVYCGLDTRCIPRSVNTEDDLHSFVNMGTYLNLILIEMNVIQQGAFKCPDLNQRLIYDETETRLICACDASSKCGGDRDIDIYYKHDSRTVIFTAYTPTTIVVLFMIIIILFLGNIMGIVYMAMKH